MKYDIEKINACDSYDEFIKKYLTKEEIDKNQRAATKMAKFIRKSKLVNIEKKDEIVEK